MWLNLAAFVPYSQVNGPGKRAVLWVQGCPLHCPGCFNPETWSFSERNIVDVEALAQTINELADIEGVTFSGGEPFAQAAALAKLAEILQQQGLNIVLFSGYTLEYLQNSDRSDWQQLLAVCDLLVAGPFIAELKCNLPLRGSSNQQLVFLSDKLSGHPHLDCELAHAVEITIQADGSIVVTGFPDRTMLEGV